MDRHCATIRASLACASRANSYMSLLAVAVRVGVMRWVQTLSWPALDSYNSAERLTLVNPDTRLTEAFVKAHDRLKFYWILGAGHSVRTSPVSILTLCSHYRQCTLIDNHAVQVQVYV